MVPSAIEDVIVNVSVCLGRLSPPESADGGKGFVRALLVACLLVESWDVFNIHLRPVCPFEEFVEQIVKGLLDLFSPLFAVLVMLFEVSVPGCH